MHVSGVILAAGSSSRLGRPKQLLLLDGEPIVRTVTRNALASKLREVILVVGAEADAISATVAGLNAPVVVNPDFALGQSTSLQAGLNAVSPASDGVLFLLGDQPEVGLEVIDKLIDAFQRSPVRILQPTYGETPGNPVLFSRALFDELTKVTGDEGARSLMKRHASDIVRVIVSKGPPPGDVDTEGDYEALMDRWKRDTALRK